MMAQKLAPLIMCPTERIVLMFIHDQQVVFVRMSAMVKEWMLNGMFALSMSVLERGPLGKWWPSL